MNAPSCREKRENACYYLQMDESVTWEHISGGFPLFLSCEFSPYTKPADARATLLPTNRQITASPMFAAHFKIAQPATLSVQIVCLKVKQCNMTSCSA